MPTPITALTAPAFYTITTGTIFGARNAKKVAEDNDLGRIPVTIAQGTKVVNSIFDQVEVFDKMAKSESALISGTAKAVNFARNNINGLIGISSIIKFLRANNENKKDVAITESLGFIGMLAGEGWMKEHLDDTAINLLKKINKNGINLNSLKNNKYYNIAKGLVFVCGSIASSNLGNFIGKKISEKVPNPFA